MLTTKKMAEHIARLAGAELTKKSTSLTQGDVSFKKHGETVTRIDREINTFIINELEAHFPDHDIITEEADAIDGNGEHKRWFVDPIDGTNNFVRQIPLYCVSIGYEQDRVLTVGAIFDPVHQVLYSGERGKGAFANDKALHVTKQTALDNAMIFEGHGYPPEHQAQHSKVVSRINSSSSNRREIGTAALMLAYLAQGRADGMILTGTKPWDCAAGAVLVREAGGRVTNFKGDDWTPSDNMIVASNGLIHDQLLELL
ncbi:inositol monophosphatase [Candidatus Uhrbacteria bacterium]|jgi:myo-inositol-1(or 4)-monophosphatase|nr:inositol monophosphatase [Candidatus Uhrbacteria bacterium]